MAIQSYINNSGGGVLAINIYKRAGNALYCVNVMICTAICKHKELHITEN
jgi:hypothetical protein